METKQAPSLNLTRSYPVAPEKVWRAWTDPQALKRWFGPGPGEPVSLAEVDLRVGGRFRIVFGGPQGKEHEVRGTYKEVERPTHKTSGKLVFTWCWPNSTPDRVSLVTLLFNKVGQGTELDFLHEQFFDEAARDGHQRGWGAALQKLEAFLKE